MLNAFKARDWAGKLQSAVDPLDPSQPDDQLDELEYSLLNSYAIPLDSPIILKPLQDARIPFIIADFIIIGVLHFVEKRMHAQKQLTAMKNNASSSLHHEEDKKTGMALKKVQRDEKQRVQQESKAAAPKGSTTQMNPQINQPDKNK